MIEQMRQKREKSKKIRMDQNIVVKDNTPVMSKDERKDLKNTYKAKYENIFF